MAEAERFPFVQLEFAGSVGLDEARYLVRKPVDRVLVVRVSNAPAPPRRRLRRRRPRDVTPAATRIPPPLTTLTVVGTGDLGDAEAATGWLDRVRDDGDLAMAEIAAALRVVNRALTAQRSAALDPYIGDLSAEHAVAVRIGYGDGDRVVDGRWESAVEIPRGERRRRAEALRPQEAVAGLLSGREEAPASVEMVLRARADLDAGRSRQAALQLRVGLEALLAELDREPESFVPARSPTPGLGGDQAGRHDADLAALDDRRRPTGEAANEALAGELSDARRDEVAETLAICERLLRRRARNG